jgi:hypothetical protein
MHMEPLPAWPGTREYLYNSFVSWVFGTPLADVNSSFKLYRTAFLKRFPIQSDGDFVHTELVAKATFLTSIMDELPLSPAPPAEAGPPPVWRELWRVFKNPDFGTPQGPAPGEPGGTTPPVLAPVDGSRDLPPSNSSPAPSAEPPSPPPAPDPSSPPPALAFAPVV